MLRIVAAAGVLVALVALMDRGAGPADALPAMRVTFSVPEGLLVASGLVLFLAWLFFMVAARSHRKPEEDEHQDEPRMTWWRQMLAQLGLIMPVVAIALILWLDGGRIAGAVLELGRTWFAASGPTAVDDTPVIALPWVGWSVGAIALVVALFTLAIALLVLFSERIVEWWLARQAQAGRVPFAEAVEESLDDLADDADPRAAILRTYHRFEVAAARARVRREPWHTADEFMRELLARLAVPDVAVDRLTRLFELARFSRHPLGPPERDRARACLDEIRLALEPRSQAPRSQTAVGA
jgi:hypothetical protein